MDQLGRVLVWMSLNPGDSALVTRQSTVFVWGDGEQEVWGIGDDAFTQWLSESCLTLISFISCPIDYNTKYIPGWCYSVRTVRAQLLI